MHEEIVERARRRLLATTVAGVVLLATSIGLLVLPLVGLSAFAVGLFPGTWGTGWGLVRWSLGLSALLGAASALVVFQRSLRRAERAALESVDLQVRLLPGARVDVVPSWRVVDGPLRRARRLADALSLAAGVLPPGVAVVVDDAPNLLAVGRVPERSWIVCTTGLLEQFPRDELEALLAYELGRIACLEVSLDTVVYACTARTYELWAGAFDDLDEVAILLAPLGLLALPLVAGAGLLRASVLRAQAALSDGLAVRYCRDPGALLRALRRLGADPRVVRFAGSPTAHLWAQYPHTRASRWLLGTHRILARRITRLERLVAPGSAVAAVEPVEPVEPVERSEPSEPSEPLER